MREKGVDCAALVACVGGGSNAIGFFSPFLETDAPELIGVEAGGRGSAPGEHASRMNGRGRAGIVQGYKSLFLSDADGQLLPTHSISAGLDYPGIGPQLAHLGENRPDPLHHRIRQRRHWRPCASSPGPRASSLRWSPRTRQPP